MTKPEDIIAGQSRLGAALVASGPDALYPAIQSGSEVVQ